MQAEKGLSTLIFSKDNITELIATVEKVHDFSDEVVVVYSATTKAGREELEHRIGERGLNKVKVVHTPPIGHSEPYQMYGLSRCKYEWVFYIDTDESPNELLKSDIRSIIASAPCDGFTVRKRELDSNGKHYHDSYQMRLYRRDNARYSGMLFEDPVIDGATSVLGEVYFLDHHFDYFESADKSYKKNYPIYAYEGRLTYADLLESNKGRGPAETLVRAFCKVRGANPDDELSLSDYRLLYHMTSYVLGNIQYHLRMGRLPNFGFLLHNISYLRREADYFFTFSEEERAVQLQVAKELRNAGGVINYLHIDEGKIAELSERFPAANADGVGFFIALLRERHSELHSRVTTAPQTVHAVEKAQPTKSFI
jgi:hypothetical protein